MSEEKYAWIEYTNEVYTYGEIAGTLHKTLEDASKAIYKRLTDGVYNSISPEDFINHLEKYKRDIIPILYQLYNFQDPEDILVCKDELFLGGDITEENFIKNVNDKLNYNRFEFQKCNNIYGIFRVSLNGGVINYSWNYLK